MSSDQNIYVSNGTCYSEAGKELGDEFIPCGNDVYGHQTCCGKGDKCLADSACFGVYKTGYGSSLTYMAGCTDPDYASSSCPKKFFGQEWEALTLCDNSGGAWAPCSQEGNPSTLQPGSYCSCTDASKTTVAFKDNTVLANIASLPQSTGATIQFLDGHTPTAAASSTETTAGSASAGTTGSNPGPSQTGSNASSGSGTPTQTGSNSASGSASGSTTASGTATGSGSTSSQGSSGGGSSSSSNSSSGLSSGAKIGIGVGVALGVSLLLGILALLFLRRRRRRSAAPASSSTEAGSIKKEKPLKHINTPPVPELDGPPVLEADGRAANPSAMRSELEGTNVFTAANLRAQEGSTLPQHPDQAELAAGTPGNGMRTEGGRYIPYRPPPGHTAQTGGPGANGMAEMSAVKTPPPES
ncbi:hypothetical protein K491DRAFT_718500 [Lophiostoma macrostomum CBS 122681]|uniref:Uncharacterized protein n=1 Tax=Lophiostoma macrostomum CBS 122681 TaxID=1314788 RepID=A0A6A6T239_9PLEO|nr:hypothetical protein K491DRAFT_718500 [Lophiostoma macrostomum CBS 122681]